jgi:hypothetical protein
MISAELYDSKPDGYGGVKLTLRRPIQTNDSASMRARGPAVPMYRGTRDDLLTGPEPVTRISLGKVWAGDDGDPLVGQANYAVQAFAAGTFAPDQPLNAESITNVRQRLQVLDAQLEAVQEQLATADRTARARGKDDACDNPKEHEAGPLLSRDSAPTKSRMWDPAPTAAFAEARKNKGAEPAPSAPAPAAASGMSATQRAMFDPKRTADWAAGMAAKRAEMKPRDE